jgi:hypothetical protein
MATSKFGEAFRAARAAGDKEFTFNGKKYNTEMADDKPRSVGGTPKMGEYKSRDEYTRSGQKSFETDAEPGESPMKNYRPRRINSILERTPAEQDEMVKQGLMRQAADRTKNDMPETAYKRGGSVKASKMGGVKTAKPSMGSASKRADGIATKGKTRGKYI